jgi:hypothetical protein
VINTAGLIDFYQDYIYLRDFIVEQQQTGKLVTIDKNISGRHMFSNQTNDGIRLELDWIKQLQIVV